MIIATWNVNSIRSRLEHVKTLLLDNGVDILGIQEIKTEESNFPFDEFKNIGYNAEVFGQKAYNGVAVISRYPFKDVKKNILNETVARTIEVTIEDITIINAYFPHGDVVGSEKFFYKLEFYKKMKNYILKNDLLNKNFILMGDFNVAKDEIDVWDKELLRGTIGFMDEEREALNDLISIGLIDAFRYFHKSEVAFTWWDYTGGSFRKNEGMRIDYIFVSKPLEKRLKNCYIENAFRKFEKPSDHAPVILELE